MKGMFKMENTNKFDTTTMLATTLHTILEQGDRWVSPPSSKAKEVVKELMEMNTTKEYDCEGVVEVTIINETMDKVLKRISEALERDEVDFKRYTAEKTNVDESKIKTIKTIIQVYKLNDGKEKDVF